MSKEQAERHNEGKLQWSLVDFDALAPMVQVLEFGAEKYSANNWKKGLPIEKICESLARHLFAVMTKKEYYDPESGLPHVGHILCNAMFLSHFSLKEEKVFKEVCEGMGSLAEMLKGMTVAAMKAREQAEILNKAGENLAKEDMNPYENLEANPCAPSEAFLDSDPMVFPKEELNWDKEKKKVRKAHIRLTDNQKKALVKDSKKLDDKELAEKYNISKKTVKNILEANRRDKH